MLYIVCSEQLQFLVLFLQRMVIKNTDPHNLSRLLLRLTPKGKIAYEQHEELHRKFNSLLENVLEGASEDNKTFLNKFLHSLETEMDDFKDN